MVFAVDPCSINCNIISRWRRKKKYLTEVFQVGENTEKRADPTSVSKAMHKVKHSDGFNILDKNDYLTHNK